MPAYLTGKRLGTSQWYDKRNRALTGCTVLHTSEGVLDSVGPDTGAEGLAEFIRTRTTAGSYHDIADSDSWIHLIEWWHGAFHDGTGSNNWALSISFACRTSDWRAMSPAKRRGFLRNGALAFVAQQIYRRSISAPLTRLRRITKAQSDRGESGFCYHGDRDPDRRSDPGKNPPNLFPFDEFMDECRVALAQLMPDHPDAGAAAAPPITSNQEDDTMYIRVKDGGIDTVGLLSSLGLTELTGEEAKDAQSATNNWNRAPGSPQFQWVSRKTWDMWMQRTFLMFGAQRIVNPIDVDRGGNPVPAEEKPSPEAANASGD